MTDLDSAKKELEALAAITDSELREKAIYDKAAVIAELTGAPVSTVVEGMAKKVDAVIASQSQPPSDYVTNFMPENGQAVLGAGFNREGIANGSLTLQTPRLEAEAGNIAGFASSGVTSDGEFTAVTAGAKYVTPAFQSGEFSGVGIGVVSASIPTNNADMDASDISLTAGAAIWHKSGVSSITTLSTDGKLGNLIIGQDFSKNIAQLGNDTHLAAHAGGSYDVGNSSTNITAGVMAQTSLTDDLTGWAAADVTLQDLGGKNDPVGMLQIGINGTPKTMHKDSDDHLDLQPLTRNQYEKSEVLLNPTTLNQHDKSYANENKVSDYAKDEVKHGKNEEGTLASMSREYYALEGHKKQQQAYLNNAAKNFSDMSGLDVRTSKQFVLNLFEYEHERYVNQDLEIS